MYFLYLFVVIRITFGLDSYKYWKQFLVISVRNYISNSLSYLSF